MLHLAKELRADLVSAGLVRAPGTAGSLPACWVQPAGGVPAPGEGAVTAEKSDPVVGLLTGVGVSGAPFEQQWLSRDSIDVVIRASAGKMPDAFVLGRKIRRRITDRRGFQLGGLRVEECIETTPLTLITTDPVQGAIFTASYLFTVRDSAYGN